MKLVGDTHYRRTGLSIHLLLNSWWNHAELERLVELVRGDL
jgi:hypothetical protein